jgi:hypothetical protein
MAAAARTTKSATLLSLTVVALLIAAATVSIHRSLHDAQSSVTAEDFADGSELQGEINRLRIRAATEHYPPYLAATLHDLSALLGKTGDQAGARSAIDEAVLIRSGLAPVRWR